jgi:hypothetical protein
MGIPYLAPARRSFEALGWYFPVELTRLMLPAPNRRSDQPPSVAQILEVPGPVEKSTSAPPAARQFVLQATGMRGSSLAA